MHSNILKLYLKALRSKKFYQTRDFLKRGNKFCSLGVLCELFRRYEKKGKWIGPFEGKLGETDAYCYKIGKEYSIELPSPTILNWAGITEEFAMELYRLNDLKKLSFLSTAKQIEVTLK